MPSNWTACFAASLSASSPNHTIGKAIEGPSGPAGVISPSRSQRGVRMSSGPFAGFASQSKWHWALPPANPLLLLTRRIFGVLGVLTIDRFRRRCRRLFGLIRGQRVGRDVVGEAGFRRVLTIQTEFRIVLRKHAVGAHLRLRFQG